MNGHISILRMLASRTPLSGRPVVSVSNARIRVIVLVINDLLVAYCGNEKSGSFLFCLMAMQGYVAGSRGISMMGSSLHGA